VGGQEHLRPGLLVEVEVGGEVAEDLGVAELLGISRSKAYDLTAQGALPVVPLAGRRKLVPRVALERLVSPPVLRLAHTRHHHAQ